MRRATGSFTVETQERLANSLPPQSSYGPSRHELLPTALFSERGAPRAIRSDNGSEFIAELVHDALREAGSEALFVAPGAPWENGYIESFNSRFRDECLNQEEFCSVLEARVVTEAWRRFYNEDRPHSSLNYMTPREFAQFHQPQLAAA